MGMTPEQEIQDRLTSEYNRGFNAGVERGWGEAKAGLQIYEEINAENEKRQAWRAYAAAALIAVIVSKEWDRSAQTTEDVAASFADDMLAEEERRFGEAASNEETENDERN